MYRPPISLSAIALALGISLFVAQLPASAQPFPSRPIRMIVPFPPGGANDILARILGQKMAENLNVNILVDNRPGASGIIGTDMVAKANADGYTVLMSPNTIAIQPSLYSSLPFDANKDLRPVRQETTVTRTRTYLLLGYPTGYCPMLNGRY